MNGWPLAYFEGPASPAKRVAETGPVADSRLLANIPAKPVGLLSTQLRTFSSCCLPPSGMGCYATFLFASIGHAS